MKLATLFGHGIARTAIRCVSFPLIVPFSYSFFYLYRRLINGAIIVSIELVQIECVAFMHNFGFFHANVCAIAISFRKVTEN